MRQIEIVCRSPGMRRCGMAHPAIATYPADHFSDTVLDILRADVNFQVLDRAEGRVFADGADGLSMSGAGLDGRSVGRIVVSGVGAAAIALRYAGLELFRRGYADEPEFVSIDVTTQLDIALETPAEGPGLPIREVSVWDLNTMMRGAIADPVIETPGAVAPGADAADEVTDNGAGATVNDLGDHADGTIQAVANPNAAVTTEELGATMVPGGASLAVGAAPVVENGRVEAIRSAIATLGDDDTTSTGRPKVKALEAALDFRPTSAEIDAALIEAVAPEAVAKT